MIQEYPGQLKPAREVSREGFDPKSLGSVMAAVHHIDPGFFSYCVGPMRTFASDECIHALHGSLFQIAAGSAAYNSDALTHFRSSGNEQRLSACGSPQTPR